MALSHAYVPSCVITRRTKNWRRGLIGEQEQALLISLFSAILNFIGLDSHLCTPSVCWNVAVYRYLFFLFIWELSHNFVFIKVRECTKLWTLHYCIQLNLRNLLCTDLSIHTILRCFLSEFSIIVSSSCSCDIIWHVGNNKCETCACRVHMKIYSRCFF